MNPQAWPQWLKLLIGTVLVAGNAGLWFLNNQTLSPATKATITGISGTWLVLVNTWNKIMTPAEIAAKRARAAELASKISTPLLLALCGAGLVFLFCVVPACTPAQGAAAGAAAPDCAKCAIELVPVFAAARDGGEAGIPLNPDASVIAPKLR